MLHLTDERLAALADDAPSAAEAEHLAVCRRCAGERVAQRRLLALAAAARDRIGPPLVDWPLISARLRDEGILGGGGERSARLTGAVRRAAIARWGIRAAAALVLVAGGGVAGRMSMNQAGAGPTQGVSADGAGAFPGAPAEAYPVYQSVDEAARAMEVAQMQYQYAATFIATRDTSTLSDERTFRARLAALDQIAATSRAALYRAPHDPVLNQYYLSTVGAREATLRQLDRALPGGSRISRY